MHTPNVHSSHTIHNTHKSIVFIKLFSYEIKVCILKYVRQMEAINSKCYCWNKYIKDLK